MKFPWANITLLLFLTILTVTGYFGLTNGRSQGAIWLWLHGIAAYGTVALLYWKSAIVLDAWRRKTVWTRQRIGFAAMLVLLLLTLVTGILWTVDGPLYIGGFSLVSIHIYLAIPLMFLMVWHMWRMRFIFRVKGTFGRRWFMGTAVAALSGLASWRLVEWGLDQLPVTGGTRRFTGSYRAEDPFPSVAWIADRPAPLSIDTYTLTLDGAVQTATQWTYAQILERGTDEQTAVLDCTGGWYTEQTWRGVRLQRLLDEAGVLDEAESVTITAVSGYKRRFGLNELDQVLLATHIDDTPLRHGYGFPLRLVVPHRRGYDWVKWVTHITINRTSKWLQSPLPLQ